MGRKSPHDWSLETVTEFKPFSMSLVKKTKVNGDFNRPYFQLKASRVAKTQISSSRKLSKRPVAGLSI